MRATMNASSCGNCAGQANQSGEDQKKLDVLANDVFINVLRNTKKVEPLATMLTFKDNSDMGLRG